MKRIATLIAVILAAAFMTACAPEKMMTVRQGCAAYMEVDNNAPVGDKAKYGRYALPKLEALATRTDGALHEAFIAFAEIQRLRIAGVPEDDDRIGNLSITGYENIIKVCEV